MRGSQQIRILVVDDDLDTVELFKALLIKEGYVVTTLLDPTKAVTTLKEGNFHLVILDMVMTKLSGTETLERIRELDDDIAVIVATGFPALETAVASLKLSASDYVRKPVDPLAFIETVKGVLLKKGITGDPEAALHRVIGRFIREGRNRQGLTLKQLARRTGLSVSLLSQIERAESSASISSLYRIATALRVRMSELFAEI